MSDVFYILSAISVVASSAVATYAINISRERLWLRSKKTEEIYLKSDELCHQLTYFFKGRYDLVQVKVFPRDVQEVRALNRQLSELNVLVGLYLPALEGSLATVLAAASSAFHWLGVAETSAEADKEHALHSLDFAVSEIRGAFDQFKTSALSVGSVDRIGRFYDALLNHRGRSASSRILLRSA